MSLTAFMEVSLTLDLLPGTGRDLTLTQIVELSILKRDFPYCSII